MKTLCTGFKNLTPSAQIARIIEQSKGKHIIKLDNDNTSESIKIINSFINCFFSSEERTIDFAIVLAHDIVINNNLTGNYVLVFCYKINSLNPSYIDFCKAKIKVYELFPGQFDELVNLFKRDIIWKREPEESLLGFFRAKRFGPAIS
jgi:hypothetical protein